MVLRFLLLISFSLFIFFLPMIHPTLAPLMTVMMYYRVTVGCNRTIHFISFSMFSLFAIDAFYSLCEPLSLLLPIIPFHRNIFCGLRSRKDPTLGPAHCFEVYLVCASR